MSRPTVNGDARDVPFRTDRVTEQSDRPTPRVTSPAYRAGTERELSSTLAVQV